jgi:hypothetical protein
MAEQQKTAEQRSQGAELRSHADNIDPDTTPTVDTRLVLNGDANE